jgi:hypothetical protein
MSSAPGHSPVNFSLKSIAVGVVCIVLAQLLLFLVQQVVTLPFAMFTQQSIATALGVLAWFFVGGKLGT